MPDSVTPEMGDRDSVTPETEVPSPNGGVVVDPWLKGARTSIAATAAVDHDSAACQRTKDKNHRPPGFSGLKPIDLPGINRELARHRSFFSWRDAAEATVQQYLKTIHRTGRTVKDRPAWRKNDPEHHRWDSGDRDGRARSGSEFGWSEGEMLVP